MKNILCSHAKCISYVIVQCLDVTRHFRLNIHNLFLEIIAVCACGFSASIKMFNAILVVLYTFGKYYFYFS